MSEWLKILALTIAVSVMLFLAIEKLLGTTDGYASRLDIRQASRRMERPDDTIDAKSQVNANPVVNSAAERNPTTAGDATSAPAADRDGDDDAAALRADAQDEVGADLGDGDMDESGSGERSDALVERMDSDGDMEKEIIVIERMSVEEAALLERLDPELLRSRPATRALDLTLADCTVTPPGSAADDVETLDDIVLGVNFRHSSIAIKGASLNRIDALIGNFERCDDAARLLIERNPQWRVDVDERAMRRREEELEYYLLLRQVPSERLQFTDRP